MGETSSRTDREKERLYRLRSVIASCMERRVAGDGVPDGQVIAEHPDLMPELAEELAKLRLISQAGHRARRGQVSRAFETFGDTLPSMMSDASVAAEGSPGGMEGVHPAALPEIPGYRIVRELHSGGQGTVYEAVQLSTRRTVALKIMPDASSASRRSQQRFEREIELIASLRHPHIVTLHDSGITRGQYYYAMDYVRGQPLDTHVRISTPDVHSLLRMFRTICEAVAHAHRMGVIHRDLKPSNILVTAEGEPVVLDFGLARVLGAPDLQTLTMPGVLLGTVPYMSPEQTLGRPEGIDTRTDVYALGVILYELLTGGPPYPTQGLDLHKAFENIRNMDPPRPSKWCRQANTEVDAIVLKAMEKDPDRRYSSACELAEDVAAWLEGRPVQAKSASSLYVIRKLAAKHSFASAAIFALVLGIGAAFSLAAQFYFREREAIEHKHLSDQAVADQSFQIARQMRDELVEVKWIKLQWFLADWRAGRRDRARTEYAALDGRSEASVVMGFWLDPSQTVDQLLAALPEDGAALAHYAAAEREVDQGDQKQAIASLEQSLASLTAGYERLRPHLQGRLRELRDQVSGPTTQPAGGGEGGDPR